MRNRSFNVKPLNYFDNHHYYDDKGIKRDGNDNILMIPENIAKLPLWKIMLMDILPTLNILKDHIFSMFFCLTSGILNFIQSVTYISFFPIIIFIGAQIGKTKAKKSYENAK